MGQGRVLIVFPASLYGGRWAAGPRVKPELVSMFTVLRRHGVAASVLDLENVVGNPAAADREAFLHNAEARLAEHPADLVVISCSSSLQYSAAVAVATIVRRLHPRATIAVAGFHVSARPEDFRYDDAPFDLVIRGDPEMALVEAARSVDVGVAEPLPQRVIEGILLEHSSRNAPEYAPYPYTTSGLPLLSVYLSRGCPYPRAACQLRPGAPGWRAFDPETVVGILGEMTALRPQHVEILDPSFGLDPGWRRAVLERVAADDSDRKTSLVVTLRTEGLTREDLDAVYRARVSVRFDIDTLSSRLLTRTGAVPSPAKHVDRSLDLLEYANAKGIAGEIILVFNQPGETLETAAETLQRLRELVARLPNASLRLHASSWAYYPYGDVEADIGASQRRYGTRILHPEWWREGIPSQRAATAVVASAELTEREPGDESYWRPQFERIARDLVAKLTADARRGLRSHEWEGALATGVPHGFWVEPRWH